MQSDGKLKGFWSENEELTQMSTEATNKDDESLKRRRNDKKQTINTYGTLDEAMAYIFASSSDDEAKEAPAARKNAILTAITRKKIINGTSQTVCNGVKKRSVSILIWRGSFNIFAVPKVASLCEMFSGAGMNLLLQISIFCH